MLCAGISIAVDSASGLWLITPIVALGCAALVLGYERHDLRDRFDSVPPSLLPEAGSSNSIGHGPPGLLLLRAAALARVVRSRARLGNAARCRIGVAAHRTTAPGARMVGGLLCRYMCSDSARAAFRRNSKRSAYILCTRTGGDAVCSSAVPRRPADREESHGDLSVVSSYIGAAVSRRLRAALAPADLAVLRMGAPRCCQLRHHRAESDCRRSGWIRHGRPRVRGYSMWNAIRMAQSIANSRREWRIGPVRIINHGIYAGAGALVSLSIAGTMAGVGLQAAILVAACAAVVGAALWAQYVEGSPNCCASLVSMGACSAVLSARSRLHCSAPVPGWCSQPSPSAVHGHRPWAGCGVWYRAAVTADPRRQPSASATYIRARAYAG